MVPVYVCNQDEIGRFCPGEVRHHRHRIDDDDLVALFDLHAGVAQRRDGEGAAGRLHGGRRGHLGVSHGRRQYNQ